MTEYQYGIYGWLSDIEAGDTIPFAVRLAGAVVLAALLGYCVYTDLCRGAIIPNAVTVPLLAAAVPIGALLHEHPAQGLAVGFAAAFFFLLLGFVGAFGMGDAKLLAGMSFLFGKAILPVFVLANCIGLLYTLPLIARARARQEKASGKKTKIRKVKIQFGPAIALAVPVVFLLGGMAPAHALGFLLVEALVAAPLVYRDRARLVFAGEAVALEERRLAEGESLANDGGETPASDG
jgi:Flp pilus assembly protein protease CpaA